MGTGSADLSRPGDVRNGLMVRYFDFNDTYLSKEPAHPSDNLAPCFAVAEAEDTSGSSPIARCAERTMPSQISLAAATDK